MIRANLQCHPSIFPPKHTVMFSRFYFLHSHILLILFLHPPHHYTLLLFSPFSHFCHSPNFSRFPSLRVLWSNRTGSLLMNQMSCRHRKTSGPNCWYAIISVFGAGNMSTWEKHTRKHTSTHTLQQQRSFVITAPETIVRVFGAQVITKWLISQSHYERL